MVRIFRITLTYFAGSFLPALFLLGCSVNATPAPAPLSTAISSPTLPAGGQPILEWQGHTAFGTDGDATRCKMLAFDPGAQQVSIGYCDGALKTSEARGLGEWSDKMNAQFAPFTYETAQDKLVWRGQGAAQGEVWQRALLDWTKLKYGELDAGRACAACGTVISWWLPRAENETACNHLYVLQNGYAYAAIEPCHNQGKPPAAQSEGWLTTDEMTQLDTWHTTRASFTQGDSYLDGLGTQTVGSAEAKQIDAWAKQVFERLEK